ncbi:MAG: ABC transporter ATP-binding protein/permease [Tannerella sp.]|jgi:ATP-binding cassette subfamily B protein|nr:ABC transporter ATP-binding protein/permease [Tannerella sp.]
MNKETLKNKQGFPRLLEIAGTKKWWLIASIFLSVCAAAAQFTPFVAVYNLLTELAVHAADPSLIDKGFIRHWGYVAATGIAGYGILTYASLMLSHIAAFHILYETRMKIIRKLPRLPLGFFTKRSSGEIKKILSEDVERIELFVAHHIPDLTTAFVVPVLLLGYMFWTDWRLALAVLAVMAVALAMQALPMASAGKNVYERYQTALGKMNGSIVEFVRGIQVVKIFNRSTKAFEQMNRDVDDYKDLSIEITRFFTPAYLGFYTVLSAILLVLIPLSVFLLQRAPSYPAYVPTVLLFLVLAGGIFFPLMKLLFMSNLMMQNATGVELIDGILNKEEVENPAQSQTPRDASVEFRDVIFAYNEEAILKGISFKALPGTVTALVGPSGAGKTTVAMLAARFWDVSSGEILIGGVPIKDIRTEDLMNTIAFVFQDNMLFFDTIEENIRMGNKTATFEEVVNVARAAQCHEFIEKLDKGYQTCVGEGGTYLSGGEQQRIALARAILKDAPIVLLDEATAYADPENEGKILSSFSRLIKGKTVLVIAHRLSTITNADRILLFNNGTIEEQGTHNELLALNGYYARMWETYSQAREWTITRKEKQK